MSPLSPQEIFQLACMDQLMMDKFQTTISGEWIQKLLPWFLIPPNLFFFFFHILFHNHDPSEKKKKSLLIVQPITLGVFLPSPFLAVSHVFWQMLPLQVLKPQRPLTCCRNLKCFRPSSLSLCPWASHGETEVTNEILPLIGSLRMSHHKNECHQPGSY